MDRDEVRSRRDALIAADGPWTSNIRLADGIYSIGDGDPAAAPELRRVVQLLRDLVGNRFAGRRVLDAGCGDGALAVELARQGAEVVALERAPGPAAKASFAGEALGLARLTVVPADARTITPERFGFFDVVVAMHLLCDVDADAVFDVASRLAAVATDVAIVSTRIAPRGRTTREHLGTSYRGATARLGGPGRGPRVGFLLTRPSLLGLLAASGFTSILEHLDPAADAEAPLLAAFKGRRVALQTAANVNLASAKAWHEPSRSRLGRVLARRRT